MNLIIMCGLPQSGKSSEAKLLKHPIVNRDAIRHAIGGSIRYYREEPRVNEIEEVMTDSLFYAGHDTVIMDACHLKQSYRNKWVTFCRKRGYTYHFNNIMTSLETCIMRAKRKFPDEPGFPGVIKNMWTRGSLPGIGQIPEYQKDNWN